MKLPPLAWWVFLIGSVAFVAVQGIRDLTSANGPDYCQMANLRSCKVSDNGTWVMVTTPDGATHMIYLKNGKVLQVQ